jgi:hypothetical protein
VSGAGLVRLFCTVRGRKQPCKADSDVAAFYNIMLGYFFGFALGVGCALAVFYAIYSGGYRKAIEHSLLPQKPKRYLEAMAAAVRRLEKEKVPEPPGGVS